MLYGWHYFKKSILFNIASTIFSSKDITVGSWLVIIQLTKQERHKVYIRVSPELPTETYYYSTRQVDHPPSSRDAPWLSRSGEDSARPDRRKELREGASAVVVVSVARVYETVGTTASTMPTEKTDQKRAWARAARPLLHTAIQSVNQVDLAVLEALRRRT